MCIPEAAGSVQERLGVTSPGVAVCSGSLGGPGKAWHIWPRLSPISVPGVMLVCFQGRMGGQGSPHRCLSCRPQGACVGAGPSSTVRPPCARLMRWPPSPGISGKVSDLCYASGETEAWRSSSCRGHAPCPWLGLPPAPLPDSPPDQVSAPHTLGDPQPSSNSASATPCALVTPSLQTCLRRASRPLSPEPPPQALSIFSGTSGIDRIPFLQ